METLPFYLSLAMALITILTVYLFYRATNCSTAFLSITACWLAVQAALALSGFYKVPDAAPPRFVFLLAPPLVFIAVLFLLPAGRRFIDSLSLKNLTLLHVIRIPVELILYGLFLNKAVPELMTFEGKNLDIVSGITATPIFYIAFSKNKISTKLLLFWNFACLALLANIAVYAILSAPSPFQQFAFDQPNIAILHFPFIWLPCCIVPLVLLSHLSAIRQLMKVEAHSLKRKENARPQTHTPEEKLPVTYPYLKIG